MAVLTPPSFVLQYLHDKGITHRDLKVLFPLTLSFQ